MRFSLRLGLYLIVIVLLQSCSAQSGGSTDTGPIDSTNDDTNSDNDTWSQRTISLVGTEPITLGARQDADITVRITDSDSPVQGAYVSFTIMGDAGGAILSNVGAYSDAEGYVTVQLRAGASSSEFRIKVSSEGAADLYLDVIVSDTGFTELAVDVVSTLPEDTPDASTISVGILFDTTCENLDPFDTDLLYTRYMTELPESVSYPSLPARREVVMVLSGKSGSHPLMMGCVHVSAEDMTPHATVQRSMDVHLYDPPLPDSATCVSSVDASSMKPWLHDEYASLMDMGSCPYGIADRLVDELVKRGWQCLEDYRMPTDSHGCRTAGGTAEEVTASSTALSSVQDALTCLTQSTDGTPISSIMLGMTVDWIAAKSPFDGSVVLSLGTLDGSEAFKKVDIVARGHKVGNHITVGPTTESLDWKSAISTWLTGRCLTGIGQPLDGMAIMDYLRERVEAESISYIQSALCVNTDCCPSTEALEDAWYGIRDRQSERKDEYSGTDTFLGGSMDISDSTHDASPEGLECTVDVRLLLD